MLLRAIADFPELSRSVRRSSCQRASGEFSRGSTRLTVKTFRHPPRRVLFTTRRAKELTVRFR